MNLKHLAAVLAALVLTPSVVFADEKTSEKKVVKPASDEKTKTQAKSEWVDLLSSDTKSLDEHWSSPGIVGAQRRA